MSDLIKTIIEEETKRFRKKFVLDPSEVFFGKKEELKKLGWEVGPSKLIVRQDTRPGDLESFLSQSIQRAVEAVVGEVKSNVADWWAEWMALRNQSLEGIETEDTGLSFGELCAKRLLTHIPNEKEKV